MTQTLTESTIMPKFIPYDPNQSKMVVVNYADQLQPGTFEHAIHFLIEHKLDLSIFHPTFNNDETGRPAYRHYKGVTIV